MSSRVAVQVHRPVYSSSLVCGSAGTRLPPNSWRGNMKRCIRARCAAMLLACWAVATTAAAQAERTPDTPATRHAAGRAGRHQCTCGATAHRPRAFGRRCARHRARRRAQGARGDAHSDALRDRHQHGRRSSAAPSPPGRTPAKLREGRARDRLGRRSSATQPPRKEIAIRRKVDDYKTLFAPEFGVKDGASRCRRA